MIFFLGDFFDSDNMCDLKKALKTIFLLIIGKKKKKKKKPTL
jgi:hypothetical protein